MEFIARGVDIGTRTPDVLLNDVDASELGVNALDRVLIRHDGQFSTGIVKITEELVTPGQLGVTRTLEHISGRVDVTIAPKPDSVASITKKLGDIELERTELDAIVQDIQNERLNGTELSAFVSGVYANGLSREEIRNLTSSMVDIGDTIEWDREPIVDKHSIGGVAGNRVTPIVVAIVAAAGLTIPKTSSRAVTSAAGTADTMEVFCPVDLSLDAIRNVVTETNGCLVWGGAVSLSPVDDKIIRAEKQLSLDPPGQVIASVLSKKKSVGATHVVVDIPYGEGAKIESLPDARDMAEDFRRVGADLGMQVSCTITRGQQPIGRGIGPVLEARDVLTVLRGDGPTDLRAKSIQIAQVLLDAGGVTETATEYLDTGQAAAKFREIVSAQGGDPDIGQEDLEPGPHEVTVPSHRDGVVTHIDNRLVNELARRAGAPNDHGAGVYLRCRVGDHQQVGTPLYTIYAEKEEKLEQAREFLTRITPVHVIAPGEALVERL